MLIIGCDFHTRYQQIAMMDDSTGELTERRVDHQNGEANTFYRSLPGAALFAPSAKGACLLRVFVLLHLASMSGLQKPVSRNW
jgi:hypothetical protein